MLVHVVLLSLYGLPTSRRMSATVPVTMRPGTPAKGAHIPAQHAGACHVMCKSMKRIMVKCVECAMACSLSAVGSVDLGAVPLRIERGLSAAMRLSRPLELRMTRLERPRRRRAERARGHRAGTTRSFSIARRQVNDCMRKKRVQIATGAGRDGTGRS